MGERYVISPTQPTPPQRLFLTAFDRQFSTLPYPQRVLFYSAPRQHHPEETSFSDISSRLRHSLSCLLVHFYPLAGRLAPSQDGSGRFEIDCNDSGVEFVEAFAHCSIQHLGDLWSTDAANDLLRWVGDREAGLDSSRRPLLLLQLTKFECGGFSLSCSFSHVVADGHSIWHFMKSWAEVCREDQVSLMPFHQREILRIDCSLVPQDSGAPNRTGEGKQALRIPAKSAVFHLSKQALAKLKHLANRGGGSHDGQPLSSFEALCAHFWQAVTRARLLPYQQETQFSTMINCRKKLEPPLPDAYFGNAISPVNTAAKAGDLIASNLSYAAELIHDAIASCNDSAIREKLELSERQGSYSVGSSSVTDLQVGSSPRFPLYETDFGWGKPIAVTMPSFWIEGFLVADPGAEGEGSVDVSIGLTSQVLERLLCDAQFLHILSSSS